MEAVHERRVRAEAGGEGTNGGAGFASLINRLLSETFRLLDQKFALLKLELNEELAAIARRTALLAVGGVVAVLGSVLLILALAFWIGELVGSLPGGFAIVGGSLVVGGGILLAVMRDRLSRQRLVPEATVEELRRDVRWIKHEL
jgi:hypothetical protein